MVDPSEPKYTLSCMVCDHPFQVDLALLPADNDVLRCSGCGRAMGTFAEAKRKLIEEAKAQVEEDLRRHFGERT